MSHTAQVLLVGSGGVGTIAALNIESGALGSVTAVLRSNHDTVIQDGFTIRSVDHGVLHGWRPTRIVRQVPSFEDFRFDYIVVTTKNIPDIQPTTAEVIAPAITPHHTVIVLIQNGLNIQLPIFEQFPGNICLSGISMIGSAEISPGVIEHTDTEHMILGPFRNPNIDHNLERSAAQDFVRLYTASGKTRCKYSENMKYHQWRKVIFNGCFSPICALTGLDSGRLRLTDHATSSLIRPVMEELLSVARNTGVNFDQGLIDTLIEVDPITMYYTPSMLVDIRKGNYIEIENLLGEPLAIGKRLNVPMPMTNVLYQLLKAVQWRIKQERGLVLIPPRQVASE